MTATLPGIGYHRSAVISPDEVYRYELTRRWGTGRQGLLFVMLNPSSADEEVDDPTIRRCISFTRREGFDHLKVINLYALRTARPRDLDEHPDPVGPENIAWQNRALKDERVYPIVVAAWGASLPRRCTWFPLPHPLGRPYYCLGVTKTRQPRHPLYLPSGAPLVPWVTPERRV